MAMQFKLVYIKNPANVDAAIAAETVVPGNMLVYPNGNMKLLLEDKSLLDLGGGSATEVKIEITPAAATWNLQHNLGKKYPDIRLFDDQGNRVYTDIDYNTTNLAIAKFPKPIAGTAFIL